MSNTIFLYINYFVDSTKIVKKIPITLKWLFRLYIDFLLNFYFIFNVRIFSD